MRLNRSESARLSFAATLLLLAFVVCAARAARAQAACTLDGDGDGICDIDDNCPDDANAIQADQDGDGRGDVCDACPTLTAGAEDACLGMGTWTRREDNGIERAEIGAAVAGGLVYIIGGQQDVSRSSVEVYDPASDAWSDGPDLPVGRHHIQPVGVDGRIYVIGGLMTFPGPSLDDVLVFDPARPGLGWTSRERMPTSRGAHGCAAWGVRIYCAGGLSSAAGNTAVAAFEVYDTVEDEWTVLAPMPRVRDHFQAQVIDGKFYAVSGRDTTITATFSFSDVYDIAGGNWSSVAPIPTARGGYASARLEGRLLIIGGEGDGPVNGVFPHVEEYDPRRNLWRRLTNLPTPRHGISGGLSRALDGIKTRAYIAAGAPKLGSGRSTLHHSFEYDAAAQPCSSEICDDRDSCTADACEANECAYAQLPGGDADGDGRVGATDALIALRASVGSSPCETCVCDVDRSDDVTASDSLIILRIAVGVQSPISCACPQSDG